MITLLDGTRLPSHSELYALWPQIEQPLFRVLFTERAQKLAAVLGLVDWDCHAEFEVDGWDVMLFQGSREAGRRYGHYDIEYKSNVTEWHKTIHEFLAQINKRRAKESGHRPAVARRWGAVLLTFDPRFMKYEDVLRANAIRLVVLPQSILRTEKDSGGDAC